MLSESVPHPPPAVLRPLMASVVGYRHEGMAPGFHRGLPSPWLTLVVTVDEPLVMAAHPDPAQPPGAFDALLGGLHTRPALIAHQGRQFGVQVSLTPLGIRALLGVPAGALASLDIDLADLLGSAARELVDRLREAGDWPARFAAVDAVLLSLLRSDTAAPAAEVVEAWRLVLRSAGRMRVEEVAARVGWSARHLGERFRAETGLTPKEAARVARFDQGRRLLATRIVRGGRPDLAALATACGFYDQAHLSREWRTLSGLPPSEWLAAELGFLQDGAWSAAAGSRS